MKNDDTKVPVDFVLFRLKYLLECSVDDFIHIFYNRASYSEDTNMAIDAILALLED